MTNHLEHFRRRAYHCRELAQQALTSERRKRLYEIATELEQEADTVERIQRRLATMNMPMPKD